MRCVGYGVYRYDVSRFDGIQEGRGVAEFGITFIQIWRMALQCY